MATLLLRRQDYGQRVMSERINVHVPILSVNSRSVIGNASQDHRRVTSQRTGHGGHIHDHDQHGGDRVAEDPPSSGAPGSHGSRGSLGSLGSLGSVGSILSIGSAGSILSIGSAGSILSIGAAGSVLSIGSAGSVLSIGSVRSIGFGQGQCQSQLSGRDHDRIASRGPDC